MLSNSPSSFKQYAFSVYRPTDIIFERQHPASDGSISFTRSSPDEFRLAFSIESYLTFGHIDITGQDVNGDIQSEVLQVSSNSFAISNKVYSIVSGVTVDVPSPESGYVKIQARSRVNEQIFIEVQVLPETYLDFQPRSSLIDKIRHTPPGIEIDAGASIYIDSGIFIPEEQDIFVNTQFGRFEVINVAPWYSHYKAELKKL